MRDTVAAIAPDTMPPNTLQQVMSNEQPLLPLPRYDEAFYLYSFKIAPCNNVLSHNWSLCPFVHAKEKARRRDPRLYSYQPLPCPEDRKGTNCPRGDHCLYTHNVYEYWLHPQRFRTQMCQQGSACSRPLCFFAHSLEELRVVDHQSNTVVSAAQLAPAPGASVPAAAPGLPPAPAGSNQAAGWTPLQGQSSGAALAQQPWPQQQAMAQPLGQQVMTHSLATSTGPQMINTLLAAMGFQPVSAQRPSMQHPVMQNAAITQQQLLQFNPQQFNPLQFNPQQVSQFNPQQLAPVNPQQPQLQQMQMQQMHALATAQLQQIQGPHGGVMQQALGVMQQAPGMVAGPSVSNLQQQQVLFNLAAAAAAAAAGPQQPQQPWLQQQQLGPGGGGARPQALQVNPGGLAAAAFGGVGVANEAALQAAMQQMGLPDNNN